MSPFSEAITTGSLYPRVITFALKDISPFETKSANILTLLHHALVVVLHIVGLVTQQNQNTYGQQNAGTYAQQNAGTYGQQNLYSQQAYTTPPQQVVYNQRITKENLPYEFQPISMWGYFGYQILFMIPIIGFIILIVFALGGTKNVNLKNFARSYFCVTIIILVVVLIIAATGGLAILGSGMNM